MSKIVYALSYQEFVTSMEMSRLNDDNISSRTRNCIIEIMGEQDLLVHPFYFKTDHKNVLRVLFDDVDEPLHIPLLGDVPDERIYIPVVPMSEDQGDMIIEFIHDNQKADVFIVHCAAGVSRSAGVARFIDWKMNANDLLFHQNNPHILPNQRIFSMLVKIEQEKYFLY